MKDVQYLVRKSGVPALAHPASDVSRLWPCTMKMLYVELNAQFTVSLESDVSIQGVDDQQLVALRFEGHNLVPVKGSLGPAKRHKLVPGKGSLDPDNIVLTPEMISHLARGGDSQVYVLSLVLKTPGAVWHPRTLSARVSGIDNLPRDLSDLARTTEVCIVFDSNWLGQSLGQLRSAVKGRKQFAGIPVVSSSKFAQSHQRALWSDYEVAESVESETAAVPPPIEVAQDDAPPAYAEVPSKRRRHSHAARTSLTTESPRRKRVLKGLTRSVSPTERATPSSQGARSTTSSNATEVADVWQEAITKGLNELLPELLPKFLPNILKDILPDILRITLTSLFAASRSPSPSQFPLHPSSSPANPPKVSALLSAHVETHLKSIFSAAAEAAAESATSLAEVTLGETLDDHDTDLRTLKEDALEEMERIAHEQVDAFRKKIEDVAEGVGEEVEKHAGEVVGNACDVLDEVVESKWVGDMLSRCIAEEQASLARESSGPD
jgi:hypothetical protein